MLNLVIDIGNTRSKIAFFDNFNLVRLEVTEKLSIGQLQKYIIEENVSRSIISSVNNEVSEMEAILEKHTTYTRFSYKLNTKIKNLYSNPDRLGLDRLAGIIGAQAMFNNTNCLVIDCGTCITYDSIDEAGLYCGGSISAGLNMRLKALNAFTEKLPLIEIDTNFNEWKGADTRSSILSGVIQGAVSEVLGFIKYYTLRYKKLQVLLCGGDAKFFDTRLKNSIFANILHTEPNLVLIGLNEVIHQQND